MGIKETQQFTTPTSRIMHIYDPLCVSGCICWLDNICTSLNENQTCINVIKFISTAFSPLLGTTAVVTHQCLVTKEHMPHLRKWVNVSATKTHQEPNL